MSHTKKLDQIASTRDFINTEEFANIFNCANQTVRKNHSEKGACFGIMPLKVGRRLLWPVAQIYKVLEQVGSVKENASYDH
jgi:hypothetical protein